jgi:hypothetical protein
LQQNPNIIKTSSKALLKVKKRQKEEAMHIEDTERLITEIEMVKVVLRLVRRDRRAARIPKALGENSSLIFLLVLHLPVRYFI